MTFYSASPLFYHLQEKFEGLFAHLYGLLIDAAQAGADMFPEAFIGKANYTKAGGDGYLSVL